MKKLKAFDYLILAIIVAAVVVAGLILTGKSSKLSKTPVEATQSIQFQVMFKGVSLTDTEVPFTVGQKSFITIRNVPYTELEITDVKFAPKKYILEIPNPKMPFILIDDPTQPFQYDFIVTLKDSAKITEDGAVVGGNKIKIGMPIVLEGMNYRLGGTVSNIIIPGKTQKGTGEVLQQAASVQPGVKVQSTDVQEAPKQEEQEKTVK